MIAGVGEALLPVLKPTKPASANPANEIAKSLTGRDYVSWSALSTFRTCPLKYKFRYVVSAHQRHVPRVATGGDAGLFNPCG